jgi:hypothetical protein
MPGILLFFATDFDSFQRFTKAKDEQVVTVQLNNFIPLHEARVAGWEVHAAKVQKNFWSP